MTDKKNACAYIRVSNDDKPENSMDNQLNRIKERADKEGLKIVKVYSEAISGATIEKRPEFQKMMREIRNYNYVIVWELDRLGRNFIETMQTLTDLKKMGIQVISTKENINLDTPSGKFTTNIHAAFGDFEKELIRERTLENKINLLKKKIPVSGALPYGRLYDKQSGQWSLDEDKAALIKQAATDYLRGVSAKEIAHGLNMTYQNLLNVFRKSGNQWTVSYSNVDPVTFDIPRILQDETIEAIEQRLAHQNKFNRTDVKRYVLSGFIRCMDCKRSLGGQFQQHRWKYYFHRTDKYDGHPCKPFSVPLERIEKAVFSTIFDNVYDETAFNFAIQESLPDEKHIESLKADIALKEKTLSKVTFKIDRLIDAVAEGLLKGDTIKAKESTLLEEKARITADLTARQKELATLPDMDRVKRDAQKIRLGLMDYFGSKDWIEDMTFEDKRRFLHWFFDGRDENDNPYGIYVKKTGRAQFAFLIYANLMAGIAGAELPDQDYDRLYDEFERLSRDHVGQGIPVDEPETEPDIIADISGRKPRFANYKTSKVASQRL